MMPDITVNPIAAAVEQISAKTPIGAALRSADWATVPVDLRQRAQFSATLENARILQTIQDKIQAALSLKKEQVANGDAFVDRSSFIGDLRTIMIDAGLSTGEGQDITDLGSRARLGLIWDMQTQQAQEFARFKSDQAPDVLNEWPAQELIRVEQRMVPRGFRIGAGGLIVPVPGESWPERWQDAGGKLIDGRMVALKTDPIWFAINRFGVPWPPFDYDSGMGLQDLDRSEAVSLGLLTADASLKPMAARINEGMAASVEGLGPDMIAFLQDSFGDQIEIVDGTAKWKS